MASDHGSCAAFGPLKARRARCFPRTLDAAMVVATDALLAARGWAETNFPRTMQAIAERLGGASYEGVARESEAPGAGRGREDSV